MIFFICYFLIFYMHTFCKLARYAVKKFLEDNRIVEVAGSVFPQLKAVKKACFVSIHNKIDHSLRGCIGTVSPWYESLGDEIVNNAVAAATGDSRFSPIISPYQLKDIYFSVDVLNQPENCEVKDLDPKKYGVIVNDDYGSRGVLLPDLEGVDTVSQQLQIACEKAGIDFSKGDYKIQRFTVERYV